MSIYIPGTGRPWKRFLQRWYPVGIDRERTASRVYEIARDELDDFEKFLAEISTVLQ